jgi:hypothetical protein
MLGRFDVLSKKEFSQIFRDLPIGHRLTAKDKKRLLHNEYFWKSLGIDQFVHGVTSLPILWWLFG